MTNLQILAGVAAIIGHIFPVFAGFRGGKGVATIFGVLLAIHPLLTYLMHRSFLSVLLITGICFSFINERRNCLSRFTVSFFRHSISIFQNILNFCGNCPDYYSQEKYGRLLKGEETRLIKGERNQRLI